MKRCPQCNHVETDESLVFCRRDGVALVTNPVSDRREAETIKLESRVTESETSLLPHTESARRSTGPTVGPSPEAAKRKLPPTKRTWIVIALVAAAISLGAYFYFSKRTAPAIESIAVMPFVNGSGNAELEYLSDGLTEMLISSLSQLENLSVKPRSSVFRYKDKPTDAQTIRKELGVQALLNGRFVEREDELTLFIELVDVINDKVVWGRQYNRKHSEMVALHTEIAADISSQLKPKLSGRDEARIAKKYTTDPQAYQHYLKGNFQRSKWTIEGYKKAIDHYNQAIQIDQSYSLAYSGLAFAHLISIELYVPAAEAVPKARAAALKALELDDSVAEAHVALGTIAFLFELDWAKTARAAKRAVELDPNNAEGFKLYGWYYTGQGQFDLAILNLKIAQGLAPLHFGITNDLAWALMLSGKVDEGIEQVRRAAELNQDWYSHFVLALGYSRKHLPSQAVEEIKKARSINDSPMVTGYTGYYLAKAGRKKEAQAIAEDFMDPSHKRHVPFYYVAGIYSALGENEKAFELLERATEQRSGFAGLKAEPLWDNIRGDQRFDSLLKRFNFHK